MPFQAVAPARRLLANPFGVAVSRDISPDLPPASHSVSVRVQAAWQAAGGGYSEWIREPGSASAIFERFQQWPRRSVAVLRDFSREQAGVAG